MFIRDLVAALDGHGVRYAVVGGVAVNLHGIPRMTYDVDVVVAPSRDPDGVTARASSVAAGGFDVRIASVDDLIAMKRLAGRKQDVADIEHLERLRSRSRHG